MIPFLMSPEDRVISHGDVGDYFYLITVGEVQVKLPDDKDLTQTLNRGDYFGECALLYDCKRSATVSTTTYCTFSRIPKEAFKDFAKNFIQEIEDKSLSYYLERN